MKDKKIILVSLLFISVLIYSYISILTDALYNYKILNYAMVIIIIILGILALKIFFDFYNTNLIAKEKLFKSLVQNSDTIYIMINSKNNEILYVSENIKEILGISSEDKTNEDIVNKVFNIPVIKNELENWDKKSSYVSSMVEYDNPKYNSQSWIRIKVFLHKNKKEEYYIVQIMDATKEHDRQHLLISQATNIKARESILNQITTKSYDFEINIDLNRNSYDLKYFKKDKLYFGEEKRGNYSDNLKSLLNYINDNDKDLVYNNLNIDALKEHFNKYQLDSISIRYRIGSDVKNNTWLESTIFFIIDRQRNIVSILTKNVTEDAQSIREQNVMLQNALNESKLVSKTKTDLISTISHDIRVPLTSIVGLSDSLLNEDLPSNSLEDIKNIKESSNEMLDIIDGLLDTSRIEKKVIEKNEKNYSIFKMFKKVEAHAKEYIGDKQIKLNVNLDNNLPVILFGDYRRITVALNEIVNNSIKYTDEGSININVRGEKTEDNVKIIVEIADTGIGIEENKLNTIMNSNINKGLGNVKNLVKLLDGKLEIESKVGEYTKVTISFIQKIVEDNKIREMISNNKNAEEFSLSGKRVIVVDDNKLNLKVTSRLLSSYELDVVLLETGEECVEYIKNNNKVDLILMDQMMPGLDGTQTMELLKKIDGFNTPIVVLTADAMQGQKEKYISSGFSDYIAKPIDKSELSRVLKKYIRNN